MEDSDTEDNFQLTHFGQSLALEDDFAEDDLGLDDEDDENLDESQREIREIRRKRKRLAEEAGINLNEDGDVEEAEGEEEGDEPQRKKSKNEVMKEVIAKSKFHKMERQLIKEKVEQETEMLDDQENFNELLAELRNSGNFDKTPAAEALNNKDSYTSKEETADDRYDKAILELATDKRAKAADRTKTEEELAKEQAEKLKMFEERRLARMRGEGDDMDDDYFSDDGKDDIDDADEFGLKSALEHSKNIREQDEDDDDQDESSEDDDSENESLNGNLELDDEFQQFSSDEEAQSGDEEEEEEEEEEIKEKVKKSSKDKSKKPSKSDADASIPYTFEMPEDVADLLDIFAKYPIKSQPTIVKRILSIYHPRLNPENKEKNAAFANILAEYIIVSSDIEKEEDDEDTGLVLDELITILRKLAEKHTESLSEFFRELINKSESRLTKYISQTNTKASSAITTPSNLFLFTLIALLYSTSDHFNQIVTPASLLIGMHLSQAPLSTTADLYAGIYVASNALTFQRIAKRYIPEVVNFLVRALYLLSPKKINIEIMSKDVFLGVLNNSRFPALKSVNDEETNKKIQEPLALRTLLKLQEDSLDKNELALLHTQMYYHTLTLLESFMTLWTDSLAFIEIFTPFKPLLSPIASSSESSSKTLPAHYEKASSVFKKLTNRLKFSQLSRTPLMLQAHKPIPIASKLPKFEANYNIDKKSYDPDTVRREHKKLQALVKKERKGALRELRKDSKFIARHELETRKKADKEYHTNLRKLISTVATEEGTEKNRLEREKRAAKRK